MIEHIQQSQISVEDIQDLVEIELMKSERTDVAKAYILYREERTKARQGKSFETIASIIRAESNDITKENANMSAETPSGMMMKFASETTKIVYGSRIIETGVTISCTVQERSSIHDLDYYPTRSLTCVQHPLDKMLETQDNEGGEVSSSSTASPKSNTLGSRVHGVYFS